ncbi:hypothetical protein DFH27DRAFT_194863 [Peziza echinospora]|nr:hypothetical protein DFH27DRAFT_194863 [Peziza echinospora]
MNSAVFWRESDKSQRRGGVASPGTAERRGQGPACCAVPDVTLVCAPVQTVRSSRSHHSTIPSPLASTSPIRPHPTPSSSPTQHPNVPFDLHPAAPGQSASGSSQAAPALTSVPPTCRNSPGSWSQHQPKTLLPHHPHRTGPNGQHPVHRTQHQTRLLKCPPAYQRVGIQARIAPRLFASIVEIHLGQSHFGNPQFSPTLPLHKTQALHRPPHPRNFTTVDYPIQ